MITNMPASTSNGVPKSAVKKMCSTGLEIAIVKLPQRDVLEGPDDNDVRLSEAFETKSNEGQADTWAALRARVNQPLSRITPTIQIGPMVAKNTCAAQT